jgi:hypothetical protein
LLFDFCHPLREVTWFEDAQRFVLRATSTGSAKTLDSRSGSRAWIHFEPFCRNLIDALPLGGSGVSCSPQLIRLSKSA